MAPGSFVNSAFKEDEPIIVNSARHRSQSVKLAKQPKKDGYFVNKVILITGASSGIGRALSYWYLNNGARVALLGINIQEIDSIARQYPAQALAIQCDLS